MQCYPHPDILWLPLSRETREIRLEGMPTRMAEDRLRTPAVDDLLAALLSVRTGDEAYALLLDLCTIREIHDMAQRLHVARMLAAGEHYQEIQKETGASATTIARVNKCLNYGADGYRIVLERRGDEADRGEDAGPDRTKR